MITRLNASLFTPAYAYVGKTKICKPLLKSMHTPEGIMRGMQASASLFIQLLQRRNKNPIVKIN